MFEGISFSEFKKNFKCDEDCFQYLFIMKWKNGYQCRRCVCKKHWPGRTKFHKRCRSCDYDESVTANTVFHKIKIPLIKAFEMAFRITLSKKSVSSTALSREFGVSQHAAWFFKRKLQEATGTDRNKTARLRSTKRKLNSKYSTHGEVYKVEKIFDHELKVEGENYLLIVDLSKNRIEKKICFPSSGVLIRFCQANVVLKNFMLWINGIHHHCTVKFLQGYLDEFFFRFRLRDDLEVAWHKMIQCFVKGSPYNHELRRGLNY